LDQALEPPYRFFSFADFERYNGRFQKYRRSQAGGLYRFIREFPRLQRPPILESIPEKVELVLQVFKNKAVIESGMPVQKISRLDSLRIHEELESAAELLVELAAFGSFYAAVVGLNEKYRLSPGFAQEQQELQTAISRNHPLLIGDRLHRLLKRLFIYYLTAGKKSSPEIAFLKRMLLAFTLFDPENAPLLPFFVRRNGNGKLSLVTAEVYFRRLPLTIGRVLGKSAADMRDLYIKQITALPLRANHRSNILGILRQAGEPGEFPEAIDRINALIRNFRLPDEVKKRIRQTGKLFQNRERALQDFYERAFLTRDQAILRKIFLHTVQQSRATYRRSLKRVLFKEKRLILYPTKDYHDYFKGFYSEDCTLKEDLAKSHLGTEEFFNLRIFSERKWIGNVYVLDLRNKAGAIVIDRIQLKRDLKLFAPIFFREFRRALRRLFQTAGYERILTPEGVISNFHMIQCLYDRFKKKEKLRALSLLVNPAEYSAFECFKNGKSAVFLVFDERITPPEQGTEAGDAEKSQLGRNSEIWTGTFSPED